MAHITAPDREAERFVSDLQDHLEDVASFYVSTSELVEILTRLLADGHTTLPTRSPDGADLTRAR